MKTTMYVLGVIVDHGRYLVVEERNGTWYLPAGRVEEGENLIAALVRETVEEAGQLIGVRGLLAIDHDWQAPPPRSRLRFVFAGYRGVAMPPKNVADRHSRRAAYLTREQIAVLPLRHPEVLDWIVAYEAAGPLLPCSSYLWSGPPGSPRAFTGVSGRVAVED